MWRAPRRCWRKCKDVVGRLVRGIFTELRESHPDCLWVAVGCPQSDLSQVVVVTRSCIASGVCLCAALAMPFRLSAS